MQCPSDLERPILARKLRDRSSNCRRICVVMSSMATELSVPGTIYRLRYVSLMADRTEGLRSLRYPHVVRLARQNHHTQASRNADT